LNRRLGACGAVGYGHGSIEAITTLTYGALLAMSSQVEFQ